MLDQRRVVSASDDDTLRVWDVETGEQLRAFEGHTSRVRAVAVFDQRRVVSASDDRTGEPLRVLEGHTPWVEAFVVLDQRRVVSASDDRTLRVWDIDTARTVAVFTLDAPARAVTFDRDRRLLVAGDSSGRVHFLDLIEPAVAPQASRSRREPDKMHR